MNLPTPITSTHNPLVKQVRKLHHTKERHRQDTFLLEGTHVVEAADAVQYPLRCLFYTADWWQRHSSLGERLAGRAETVRAVTPMVLKSLATTVNPAGVVATAVRRLTSGAERSASVGGSAVLPSLGLAVERLQDPGNLGTIIRTVAAAGADGLWLSDDSVDIDHPKVLRASAGQWFRSPLQVYSSLSQALASAQAQSAKVGRPLQIVATTPTASAAYWALDLRRPTIFVLGNEGSGLSASLLQTATHEVSIPLATGVESLNVAISAALFLYEACRQRQDASTIN